MPTYRPPGVYIEEEELGSRPITGVATAVAAFVGVTMKGPSHTPTLVTNWSQFTETFGDFLPGWYLAHSVYGYFQNGGGACYIVRINGTAVSNPTAGAEHFDGSHIPGRSMVPTDRRSAPRRLSPGDYVGRASEGTGIGGLEAIDGITMVSVPDLMSAYQQGMIDLGDLQAVQQAMIAHCELKGDRMAILDPPPGLNSQQIKEWRVEQAGYDSEFACLYWPWIKVLDPATGANVFLPPNGQVAGIWSRSDETRGVHKAPANENVRGAIDLAVNPTKSDQELLNPVGVNCIRAFGIRGLRVWGARTLSSNPEGRYVNVRRLLNYLEKTILDGTAWVVFEPNDETLWARIRHNVAVFLENEWRKGALFGATAAESFYVKCDGETNPAQTIAAIEVAFEVGVAPMKPAEFLIFRLSQKRAPVE